MTIELRLIGPISAATSDHLDVLPTLRKARAIFVVLAMADGQNVTRRWLAALLWSGNQPAQGLARLRDTLSILRHSLRDRLGSADILLVTADRVGLQPGRVNVDLTRREQLPPTFGHLDIATELDGVDPAFDDWLLALRGRYRASVPAPVAASGALGGNAKRGVVIAVTPLHVIGAAPGGELAFVLAEEISASLSRIRGFSVVLSARAGLAGPEAALDFTLEGSLQFLGPRLRVAVKLVEAPSGVVCWSRHFDYDNDDTFHIQQDVAALVAAGLEPEMPSIATERLRRLGIEGDGPYSLMLRAISLIHLLDRRSFHEAGDLLSRIIELEPEYSSAHSWLAFWHVFQVGQGWAADPRASVARAGKVAEHAVMLDPNDARGLAIAGHVRAFLYRRLEEAIPLHERALAINPTLPLAWNLSGVTQLYKGSLEEARRQIDHCLWLAPRDPHIFFCDAATTILELLSRRHEAAAILGRKVTQLHPRFSAAYKPYLSALGHLKAEREASLVHQRLLKLEPDFTIRSFRATAPFVRREQLDHYVSGLTLAGVR